MLNKQTKIDAYPILQIYRILDCFCKAQVFLKIDMSKAYYPVIVKLSHIHKPAFLTKYGLLKLLSLSFRLVNTPSIF